MRTDAESNRDRGRHGRFSLRPIECASPEQVQGRDEIMKDGGAAQHLRLLVYALVVAAVILGMLALSRLKGGAGWKALPG